MSCACPLNQLLTGHISSNEYGLYADKLSTKQLQGLKRENDRFCLEDTRYQRDRKFFAKHPDWVTENTFVPGDIQPCPSRGAGDR
jgi:hypothetical protein